MKKGEGCGLADSSFLTQYHSSSLRHTYRAAVLAHKYKNSPGFLLVDLTSENNNALHFIPLGEDIHLLPSDLN